MGETKIMPICGYGFVKNVIINIGIRQALNVQQEI